MLLRTGVPKRTHGGVRWHLAQLDALRGLAVLGVVLVHCGGTSSPPWSLITLIGQRGVQLFFIVSAFTLFLSHENRKEDESDQVVFFLRRAFRLVPMYYFAFMLTALLFPKLLQPVGGTLLQLTFLHGLTPATINSGVQGSWSLADEAFFYFTLPFLFRWIRNLRAAMLWLSIAAPLTFLLSYELHFHTRPDLHPYFTFLWFPVEFPVFLMGIVAYFYWKEKLKSRTHTPGARCLSLTLIAIAVALLPLAIRGNPTLLPTSAGLTCLTVAVALEPWPLLVNRATILLGKLSYSIYLLHFFLLYWAVPEVGHYFHLEQPAWMPAVGALIIRYCLVLGGTTAISLLTWKWVEQPGIRLGRRLIARRQSRKPRPHSVSLDVPLRAAIAPGDSPDAQF